MTFNDLQKLCEDEFGTSKLSDIALELGVTPQVVSNWKSRNTVPYKYVKKIRKKISARNIFDNKNINKTSFDPSFVNAPLYDSDGENGFKLLFILLVKLKKSILDNLLLFLIIPSIITTFTFLRVVKLDPIFVSEAKIIPAMSGSAGSGGQLQSLAENLGFSTGGSASGNITSADLFPEVIISRRLSRTLLKRKFNTQRFGKDIELLHIMNRGEKSDNKEKDIKDAVNALIDNIEVISYAPQSPLIVIKVSSFEPQLAADLASTLVEELNKLQKYFKNSKISEKKDFISGRIIEVEKQLIKAEENLKIFRESNRSIFQSPSLMLEQERLVREVSTLMQLYLTLKSQYELVQIELFDGSNMVEILDKPEAPLYKKGPAKKMLMITAFFFSLGLSIIVVFFKDWFELNILK